GSIQRGCLDPAWPGMSPAALVQPHPARRMRLNRMIGVAVRALVLPAVARSQPPGSPLGLCEASSHPATNARPPRATWVPDLPRPPPTMPTMIAVIWHYWLGMALAIGAIATVGALAAGYLPNVESTPYPT